MLAGMAAKSPDEILAEAVESARNVKFGRGVVSKTSYVAALVVGVWIVVAWQWGGDPIADGGLLIAGAAAILALAVSDYRVTGELAADAYVALVVVGHKPVAAVRIGNEN